MGLTKNAGEAKFNASGLTLEAGAAGAVNTVNFTGVSGYNAFTVGDITLSGYNTLSFDSDASGSIGNISVSGMENTISNPTNLTMQAGKTLNFDLTGLSSANVGGTMLNINGGNLTADAGGTSVTVSNIHTLSSADFNWDDNVTLADLSSGTFNYTSTSGNMAPASNYELSYAVAMNSANVLQFLVNGLTADATYIGSIHTDMLLENGAFYKNQGTLNFSGNILTVDSGHDFYAGVLNLAETSNPTLDFSTATAWDAGTQTGAGFGDLYLGSINADGTAGIGNTPLVHGVLGSNYVWSGNLIVSGINNSLASITNAAGTTDLSGKTITFNLPTNLTAGDTLLSGSNAKLTGANIAMTVASAGGQPGALNSLNAGDKVILISDIDHSTWSGSQAEATTSGGAVDYTFALGAEQLSGIWSLVSTLKSEIFDDGKAHNALMSASAMNLLLAEGGDSAASLPGKFVPSGQGQGQAGNMQYGSFMDMGAGHSEMKTGSHVESDNFHLLVGPGLRFNHAGGAKTDLGLFFETGWGNFDTYNSFYRGNGDTSYSGAGLLARHDMACGLYGETSLRMGRAKSEYDSRYDTGYDLSSTYYGGHLGLGYVLQVSEPGSLDFSAKLLYTGLQGDSDTNSAGDRMKVDDTDSTRTQLGVKYEHQLGDSFNAFTRVAWDYEFDGKTTGHYNQYEISNSDPSGSTGIGEIGLQWQAAQNFSVGLATHGLTGKREGYGGDLSLRLAF